MIELLIIILIITIFIISLVSNFNLYNKLESRKLHEEKLNIIITWLHEQIKTEVKEKRYYKSLQKSDSRQIDKYKTIINSKQCGINKIKKLLRKNKISKASYLIDNKFSTWFSKN